MSTTSDIRTTPVRRESIQRVAKTRDPVEDLIRENLVKFMAESGYSQNQIADLSGVPQANLGRYVRGENAVSAGILKSLADVFGRSVGDFYEHNPPPARKPDERDDLFLRARPDVDIPPDVLREVNEYMAKKNADLRALKMGSKRKK